MLKPNPQLIIDRGIQPQVKCNDTAIDNDVNVFINNLIANGGQLPLNPPFEIHPYKDGFPLQNFDKYIIGTFPPISYILDNPAIIGSGINNLQQPAGAGGNMINRPWIPFYHGNQGSMWNFLLSPIEMAALNAAMTPPNGRLNGKQYLTEFLHSNKLNYADIIEKVQRRKNNNGLYSAADQYLNNICPNFDLICHILSNANAKTLLFNTASIFGNQGMAYDGNGVINIRQNTKSFDIFIRSCQELGLELFVQIQNGNPLAQYRWTNINKLAPNQRSRKIIFELKIKNPSGNKKLLCQGFQEGDEKVLTVITGPSPSRIAIRGLNGNHVCGAWLAMNPNQNNADFINWVYQNFRVNGFNGYYNLNLP